MAIGITAVPTPITEEDWDGWFVYEVLAGTFRFGSAIGFNQESPVGIHFDSKAQRKVEDDNAVVVVLQNPMTVGVDFFIKFRQLYKLA